MKLNVHIKLTSLDGLMFKHKLQSYILCKIALFKMTPFKSSGALWYLRLTVKYNYKN